MKQIHSLNFSFPRLKFLVGLALLTAFIACRDSEVNGQAGQSGADVYGKTPVGDYLTGKFNSARHEKFTSLNSLGIPGNGRTHRLRREAALQLKKMYLAFRKDHPGVPFRVISSTRSFYTQKRIWEGKWNGSRRVEGLILTRSHPDHFTRGMKILRYSSMPGTSRHHWGTDFDLTSLNNSYFESGKGKLLYSWLRRNADRYGFCQPYTAGRSAGYLEERWHWSYRPLARRFLRDWKRIYGGNTSKLAGGFAGSKTMHAKAPVYVESISGSCK